MELSAAVLLRRRAAALVGVALACGLAAGALGLGYVWLKSSGMFTLRTVAVRGGTESDRVAARDAVARAAAGRSLLSLSPAQVAKAIEQVPTIRVASVDRDFPHTLRIRIEPERAVALAVSTGHYRSLVAASGRVLRVFDTNERVPSLPRIMPKSSERPVPGGSMHSPAMQAALEALSSRPKGFRARITNVKVEPERGIVMHLSVGLDIVLGPPLQLDQKLEAAAWVLRHYPTRDERAQLLYADVSAPNRPAVMPRGGYTETAGLGQEPKKSDTGSKTAGKGV